MSSNLLSGIKVIARDRVDAGLNEASVLPNAKNRRWTCKRKEKRHGVKNKSSDDELERIDKRKKKKWYSSDEYSISSSGSETECSSSELAVKKKSRKRKNKIKKSTSKRSNSSEDELGSSGKVGRSSGSGKKKKAKMKGSKEEHESPDSKNNKDDKMKELGLDWMLRPKLPSSDEEGSLDPVLSSQQHRKGTAHLLKDESLESESHEIEVAAIQPIVSRAKSED